VIALVSAIKLIPAIKLMPAINLIPAIKLISAIKLMSVIKLKDYRRAELTRCFGLPWRSDTRGKGVFFGRTFRVSFTRMTVGSIRREDG